MRRSPTCPAPCGTPATSSPRPGRGHPGPRRGRNYHAVFPVDTDDEADQERAEAVNARSWTTLWSAVAPVPESTVSAWEKPDTCKRTRLAAVHARDKEDRRPQRHYEPGQDLQQRNIDCPYWDGTGGSLESWSAVGWRVGEGRHQDPGSTGEDIIPACEGDRGALDPRGDRARLPRRLRVLAGRLEGINLRVRSTRP